MCRKDKPTVVLPSGAGGRDPVPRALFTRAFAALMIVQASFGYCFSSFLLLPKFLLTELGARPAEIGLAMAVYGATAVVCIPVMGAVVDRFGRRDFLTAGAICMAAASAGFIGVRDVGPLLYGLRAFQGVAFSMAFVAGVTLAVDQAPAERLGQAIALIGLAMLSMNAIAPAILEVVVERLGWAWGFATAAGAALACGALSRRLRDPGVGPPPDGVRPTLWDVLTHPAQIRIATVVALTGAAFGAMITFHQPFALALGIEQVRGFFMAYAAAAIVVRVGFGRFIDRGGRRRISVASLVVYGCVASAMARLTPALLAPLGVGLGIAHGLFYPSLNAIAVADRSEHERGKVMALFQAAFSVGFAGGTYPLGLLAERAGYPAVFVVAGGCAFLALGVLLISPDGRAASAAPQLPARRAASRSSIGGWE